MASNHCLRFADYFELTRIEGRLHDTVIELDDQHVLIIVAECVSQKLNILNLVSAELPSITLRILRGVFYFFTALILCRHELELPTKQEERLLVHV